MGYIKVKAQLPGIYGNVNRPCPRATPSDSDQFTDINPRQLGFTYSAQKYLLRSSLAKYLEANIQHFNCVCILFPFIAHTSDCPCRKLEINKFCIIE